MGIEVIFLFFEHRLVCVSHRPDDAAIIKFQFSHLPIKIFTS